MRNSTAMHTRRDEGLLRIVVENGKLAVRDPAWIEQHVGLGSSVRVLLEEMQLTLKHYMAKGYVDKVRVLRGEIDRMSVFAQENYGDLPTVYSFLSAKKMQYGQAA